MNRAVHCNSLYIKKSSKIQPYYLTIRDAEKSPWLRRWRGVNWMNKADTYGFIVVTFPIY